MRKLMITVDVEAQPARAERDHVVRLIWGEYPEGRGGIGEMMDMGDTHGCPIVMFVDYCERALYGDDILDVAREVHRRGHDLQLHSHPEFLAETFWTRLGLTRPPNTNNASDEQAEALVNFLCVSQAEAGCVPPLAYRGGGYRYGPAILRALGRHGVLLDSSYIAARENQPLRRGLLKPFLWDNGCLEVPVSCVNPFLNLTRDFDLNFNASAFSSAERMIKCMDAFYNQQGDDAIACMVLHSWSFSRRQENGFFSAPLYENMERFDAFLGLLKSNGISAISSAEAVRLAQANETRLGDTIAIEEIAASQLAGLRVQEQQTAVTPTAVDKGGFIETVKDSSQGHLNGLSSTLQARAQVSTQAEEKHAEALGPALMELSTVRSRCCTICQTSFSAFQDYNGRAKVRCPKCGSVERQRVFVEIYDAFLSYEFDLRQKRVLALSPSNSERMIYQQRDISNIVSCDIQPQLKTDIIADITSMPQVASSSFDAVIASYVMTCVHDLDAALSEIHRVLKPGGRFLFCDPLKFNSGTIENTDIGRITSWYGLEAYDKYKIGSFRQLGDIGTLESLAPLFHTKTFYGVDPITDSKWVWHAAIKSKAAVVHTAATVELIERQTSKSTVTAEDKIVNDAQYLVHDNSFRSARVQRPRLTYAQWSVENQIRDIKEGKAHPSLGPKLIDNDWTTAGLSTFQRYKSIIPDLVPSSKVVDYGCGSLRLGHHFIRFLNSGNYIGVDVWEELIEIGVDLIEADIVEEKRPIFAEISPISIDLAIDSNADVVFACSVAYQVHPWDYAEFVMNLQKIAHKPGSWILFDTKLAAEHFRYKESGWAWTQNFYDQLFDGFEPMSQTHQLTQMLGGREVETHLFAYRRP